MPADGGTQQDCRKHVIVCGAGVIGACTAYYAARQGLSVTVIERDAVACAASGKAGGFLASDLSEGEVCEKLMRFSFGLHEKLSEELGVEYGFRRLDTLNVHVDLPVLKVSGHDSEEIPGNSLPATGAAADLNTASYGEQVTSKHVPHWLNKPLGTVSHVATTSTSAQVHPKLFTQAVMDAAVKKWGVRLLIGDIQDVLITQEGERGGPCTAKGVKVDDREILADFVVLCLGPWTSHLPSVPKLCAVGALLGHSVVFKPKQKAAITPHALFLNLRGLRGDEETELDVFPRPTGEVFVCGINSVAHAVQGVTASEPLPGCCERIKQVVARISTDLAEADVILEQACLRPVTSDGIPVIGGFPEVVGLYIGSGHGFWGINNGPGTGHALAELLATGVCSSLDLSPFSPARF